MPEAKTEEPEAKAEVEGIPGKEAATSELSDGEALLQLLTLFFDKMVVYLGRYPGILNPETSVGKSLEGTFKGTKLLKVCGF